MTFSLITHSVNSKVFQSQKLNSLTEMKNET